MSSTVSDEVETEMTFKVKRLIESEAVHLNGNIFRTFSVIIRKESFDDILHRSDITETIV